MPTEAKTAAARVDGVRPGCAVAVRLDAGHSRESFAVAVESKAFDDHEEVRRIEHQVVHEVVVEVNARPRNVVVLAPGVIPKTPSGKLRRANSVALACRRPMGWRHWAEVVWSESRSPEYIGDMPHTWIGAEFACAVRRTLALRSSRSERRKGAQSGLRGRTIPLRERGHRLALLGLAAKA